MNILIADDSLTIRKMIINLIMKHHPAVSCIEAKDGKDAFHELTKNKIDLIITDMDMGAHDGGVFVHRILGNKLLKSKNIIVFSSEDKSKLGIVPSNVHFIDKSLGQDGLINKINQLLAKH